MLFSLTCLVLGSFVHLHAFDDEGLDASGEDVNDALAEPESAEEKSLDSAPAEENEVIPRNSDQERGPRHGVLYGVGFGLLGLLLFGSGLSGAVKVAVLMALVTPLMAKKIRQDVLNRGRVLGFVEANAGIHFSAIKSGLGLANGVTAHHLQTLERQGTIISWRDGKMRRYAAAHIDPTAIPDLQSPLLGTRLVILQTLAEAGSLGLTATELRERLDISRQLLHHHMTQLSTRTLVVKTASSRRSPWRLTETGFEALDVQLVPS